MNIAISGANISAKGLLSYLLVRQGSHFTQIKQYEQNPIKAEI